jgi:hypothetical protein
MNTTLTVDDPLAGREVTIVITLSAGEQPRDERPMLLSLGMAGQRPVIQTGVLGDVPVPTPPPSQSGIAPKPQAKNLSLF